MDLLKKRLLSGETVTFSNEEYQLGLKTDDPNLRGGKVFYKESPSWVQGYKIWFNGALIHHCKTWKSFERRLNILIEKWNLKEGSLDHKWDIEVTTDLIDELAAKLAKDGNPDAKEVELYNAACYRLDNLFEKHKHEFPSEYEFDVSESMKGFIYQWYYGLTREEKEALKYYL